MESPKENNINIINEHREDGLKKEDVTIGLDLGTTYSCVGVFINGKVEIIPNEMGDPTTPSIVTFMGNDKYVGEETFQVQTKDPKNTIYGVKRLIGRYYEDKEVQNDIKYWPYRVIMGEKQEKGHIPKILVDYKGKEQIFSPEEISSFVISKIKQSVERHLRCQVNNCVITVPAHFNDEQKNATRKACEISQLKVLRILHEPEAAAMAYHLEKSKKKPRKNGMETPGCDDNDESLVLIFDLGGGTFDISILSIKDGVFTVKEKYGDPHFGGEDFDNILVQYCINVFRDRTGILIDKDKDSKEIKRLKLCCEKAKRILSSKEKTQIEIHHLKNEEDLSLEIIRETFEKICKNLFIKCTDPIYNLLYKIGKGISDVDQIILIGGSSRIPRIKEMLKNLFFKDPYCSINPDEAVAYGATLLAAKLSGEKHQVLDKLVLKDVTPFTLGIAVFDPLLSAPIVLLDFLNILEDSGNEKKIKLMIFNPLGSKGLAMSGIIPRGSVIPFYNTEKYRTINDNQEMVKIEVYEGESKFVKDNNLLGVFELRDLPKKKAGEVVFDVTFTIDANCLLTVKAVLIEGNVNKGEWPVHAYKGGIGENELNLIKENEKKNKGENSFNSAMSEKFRKLHEMNNLKKKKKIKNLKIIMKKKKKRIA